MNTETTVEKETSVKNGVRRLIFVGVAIVIELVAILVIFLKFNEYAQWIAIVTRLLSALLVLLIYNENKPSSMKMTWIIVIMAFPIVGVALYMLIGLNWYTHRMRKRYEAIDRLLMPLLPDDAKAQSDLNACDERAANIAHYISASSAYPLYENTSVTYYDDASKGIEAQKEDLRKAEHFIFMEYHAIEDAESWHAIQDILAERAAAGVDVRVFYDDMGSIGFVNVDFVGRLEAVGIKARVFNPFAPGLNLFLNNRDHRKITVIDGLVGYTGGYNLANEYFNLTHPYGHWKDTGIRLEGEAVKSLTAAFLEMWNAINDFDEDDATFRKFLPDVPESPTAKGFVQPYADNPMDTEQLGEDVYISVAEYAKDYAWFVSPYLIITDEMTHALGLAAKRGVDVRLITPGIPDKKIVYAITRSYYYPLVRNGVRVFEYTPGFVHAKMSVADDALATCGTINLDYRSLYHHFENGCIYYGCDAVTDTRADFEWMFEQSREVTEQYKKPGYGMRLWHLILRLASSLM